MKQFLENYGLLLLKCVVLTPALLLMNVSKMVVNTYTLVTAAILGDGVTFNNIYHDSLNDL